MYRLTTSDSKVNLNVTGEYLTCFAETKNEKVYKTIKKNTISAVELKQGTNDSKKGNLVFFAFGLLLVLAAAFLLFFLKGQYAESLEFFAFDGALALLGVVFLSVCRPRTKSKRTVYLNVTNSNGTSLLTLPLGEFNPEIANCVNKLALDVLSSKKPDFSNEKATAAVFDLESPTWY